MTSPAHEASDRAARWILRQEEPDWSPREEAELEAWLAESSLHRAAYLRQQTGWRAADRIGSLGPIDGEKFDRPQSPFYRRWQPWAIAASLALVVGAGSTLIFSDGPPRSVTQAFATPIGAQQKVVLADHSKVELNTATRLRAAVTAHRREVWLDQGEAFFDIRHREHTPFVVHVGTRSVTVLGTKFAIRRDGTNVTVSVLEGRVRVDATTDAKVKRSTTISAGDVAVVRDNAMLVAEHAETRVENALGWREGMLNFSDARLADAAREFNRYHRRQILVTGKVATDMRIDGAFQAANIDGFTHLLRDAYGLRVTEDGETIKISE
ncbi:FecR family protein [Sphingobium ummariense]|uniref:FecR protein domain-containing protein n=1 Tax=Sphingobium ummariense RL-3 TaxID=1346791 RepID=T0J070_9SPHN|nr:FecR domain-containing protein [Sphingobium ummariense]EQB31391.1 hypothetical protein M529_14680 [Sphingobium ummariense RL-3]